MRKKIARTDKDVQQCTMVEVTDSQTNQEQKKLSDLPVDIFDVILSYLTLADIVNLGVADPIIKNKAIGGYHRRLYDTFLPSLPSQDRNMQNLDRFLSIAARSIYFNFLMSKYGDIAKMEALPNMEMVKRRIVDSYKNPVIFTQTYKPINEYKYEIDEDITLKRMFYGTRATPCSADKLLLLLQRSESITEEERAWMFNLGTASIDNLPGNLLKKYFQIYIGWDDRANLQIGYYSSYLDYSKQGLYFADAASTLVSSRDIIAKALQERLFLFDDSYTEDNLIRWLLESHRLVVLFILLTATRMSSQLAQLFSLYRDRRVPKNVFVDELIVWFESVVLLDEDKQYFYRQWSSFFRDETVAALEQFSIDDIKILKTQLEQHKVTGNPLVQKLAENDTEFCAQVQFTHTEIVFLAEFLESQRLFVLRNKLSVTLKLALSDCLNNPAKIPKIPRRYYSFNFKVDVMQSNFGLAAALIGNCDHSVKNFREVYMLAIASESYLQKAFDMVSNEHVRRTHNTHNSRNDVRYLKEQMQMLLRHYFAMACMGDEGFRQALQKLQPKGNNHVKFFDKNCQISIFLSSPLPHVKTAWSTVSNNKHIPISFLSNLIHGISRYLKYSSLFADKNKFLIEIIKETSKSNDRAMDLWKRYLLDGIDGDDCFLLEKIFPDIRTNSDVLCKLIANKNKKVKIALCLVMVINWYTKNKLIHVFFDAMQHHQIDYVALLKYYFNHNSGLNSFQESNDIYFSHFWGVLAERTLSEQGQSVIDTFLSQKQPLFEMIRHLHCEHSLSAILNLMNSEQFRAQKLDDIDFRNNLLFELFANATLSTPHYHDLDHLPAAMLHTMYHRFGVRVIDEAFIDYIYSNVSKFVSNNASPLNVLKWLACYTLKQNYGCEDELAAHIQSKIEQLQIDFKTKQMRRKIKEALDDIKDKISQKASLHTYVQSFSTAPMSAAVIPVSVPPIPVPIPTAVTSASMFAAAPASSANASIQPSSDAYTLEQLSQMIV